MNIKEHNNNPECKDLMNDKEWFESYKQAYADSKEDEELAEVFMVVSAEADRIMMNEM